MGKKVVAWNALRELYEPALIGISYSYGILGKTGRGQGPNVPSAPTFVGIQFNDGPPSWSSGL